MLTSPLEQKIQAMIEPSLDALGYAVVQIKIGDGMKRKALQILAERKGGDSVSVDDCVKISRTVSSLLEVEDPIAGEYNLEVSSPGIDRPLMTRADFERYVGQEAKVETSLPIDGRKRFRGEITRVVEAGIVLTVDGVAQEVEFDNIRQAKLVLTDALLAWHKARRAS